MYSDKKHSALQLFHAVFIHPKVILKIEWNLLYFTYLVGVRGKVTKNPLTLLVSILNKQHQMRFKKLNK